MIECEYLTTATLHRIADLYGYKEQSLQCQEELAECIVAINKLHRAKKFGTEKKRKKWRRRLISEIADVMIMLQQIIHLLDCQEELEAEMDRKTQRQVERMKEAGIWESKSQRRSYD